MEIGGGLVSRTLTGARLVTKTLKIQAVGEPAFRDQTERRQQLSQIFPIPVSTHPGIRYPVRGNPSLWLFSVPTCNLQQTALHSKTGTSDITLGQKDDSNNLLQYASQLQDVEDRYSEKQQQLIVKQSWKYYTSHFGQELKNS